MATDDLVQRLREKFWYRRADGSDKLAKEAADEIERLRARIDEIESVVSAVRPQFAQGMRDGAYIDHRLGRIVHDPASHTEWSYHRNKDGA